MPPDRKKPPRTPELGALGRAIEKRRDELGWTQEEVGDPMRRDHGGSGPLERGQGNPTYLTLLRLAAALEVRLSELIAEAEQILDEEDGGLSGAAGI